MVQKCGCLYSISSGVSILSFIFILRVSVFCLHACDTRGAGPAEDGSESWSYSWELSCMCREWNPGFLQERARAPANELLLPPVHFKPKREKEKKENVSLEEESGGGGNLHIYSMVICSETLADAWNQTDRSAVCAV